MAMSGISSAPPTEGAVVRGGVLGEDRADEGGIEPVEPAHVGRGEAAELVLVQQALQRGIGHGASTHSRWPKPRSRRIVEVDAGGEVLGPRVGPLLEPAGRVADVDGMGHVPHLPFVVVLAAVDAAALAVGEPVVVAAALQVGGRAHGGELVPVDGAVRAGEGDTGARGARKAVDAGGVGARRRRRTSAAASGRAGSRSTRGRRTSRPSAGGTARTSRDRASGPSSTGASRIPVADRVLRRVRSLPMRRRRCGPCPTSGRALPPMCRG